MKKKDIWISTAIISAAALVFCYYSLANSLTKGSIKIDAGSATAVLQLRSVWFSQEKTTVGQEPATVNARIHKPELLSVSMGQEGYTWKMDSSGPWGNLSRIKVKNDNTTVLRLGPPFLIKPRVRKSGSDLSIDFAIFGQAGEQYQNFVRKGNRTITGAKFKIVDEAGNVLINDRFRYG
jgi:hypothetical protein